MDRDRHLIFCSKLGDLNKPDLIKKSRIIIYNIIICSMVACHLIQFVAIHIMTKSSA